MRLSQKKQNAVYAAIHEAVMQARLQLNRDTSGRYKINPEVDMVIAQIVTHAFRDVLKALGAEGDTSV